MNLEVIQENKANNQLECVLNCLHTNGCTLFDFSLDTYDCTLFENHAEDLIGNILVTLEEPFEQHMCGFLGSEKEHKSEEKSQVRGNEADEYDSKPTFLLKRYTKLNYLNISYLLISKKSTLI